MWSIVVEVLEYFCSVFHDAKDTLVVILLGEMHGIVGRAWCYDRWYVYTYH